MIGRSANNGLWLCLLGGGLLSAAAQGAPSGDGTLAVVRNAESSEAQTSLSESLNQIESGDAPSLRRSMQTLERYYDQVREQSGGVKPGKQAVVAAPTGGGQNKPSIPRPVAPATERRGDIYRDPFAMTEALIRKSGTPGKELEFSPVSLKVQVPKLSLKGVVNKGEGEMAALLDMEGYGTYVVREGDTLSLPDQGENSVIKIQRIDRLSLVVQVGMIGQVIVVR